MRRNVKTGGGTSALRRFVWVLHAINAWGLVLLSDLEHSCLLGACYNSLPPTKINCARAAKFIRARDEESLSPTVLPCREFCHQKEGERGVEPKKLFATFTQCIKDQEDGPTRSNFHRLPRTHIQEHRFLGL